MFPPFAPARTPHATAMRRPVARALAALAMAASLSLGAASLAACSQGEAASGAGSEGNSALLPAPQNDAMPKEDAGETPSGKLRGATESIDENGIVHGVTLDGIRYTVHGRGLSGAAAGRVTLAAAGDQIGSADALAIADRYAGESGDGAYSFEPWYQEVAPFIQQFDLRYVNQETVMAGNTDGYSYSGYPSFNTPDSAAEALSNAGFNMVNFCTNHTYDMGTYGIERSHEVWARYPQLMIGGSYLTQEDRETVHMIERNGMTFAFLAYTYGDNNYMDPATLPNRHYACPFDKDEIAADVRRAQQVADAVIVSMHWGSEYTTQPNDQQYEYAEFLADLDVDLVLGTHAHIMQPVEYITGESGNTVPVVFGLSDFVSGWTITDCILSGIFTCDFVRGEDGGVVLENPVWHPTIEWSDGGDVYVRMLENMDDATIDANLRTPDVGNDSAYLRDMVHSLIVDIPSAW